MKESYECPESESFLDKEEFVKGHKVYFPKQECIRNYVWGNCEGSCEQAFLDNSEYYLLQEYALTDGFEEFSTENTVNNQGELKTTKSIIQGFFVDNNRTRAIISDVANPQLLPEKISNQLLNLIPIDHIYEGYEYSFISKN